MALLSFSYNKKEFTAWYSLIKLFPEMNVQALGFIGNEGKKIMKKQILSGQELQYRTGKSGKRWSDIKGRSKVSYGIVKRGTVVKISSYPANFFSVGRKLRDGKRETKKKIYPLLKSKIESSADAIINKFDQKHLQKILDRYN